MRKTRNLTLPKLFNPVFKTVFMNQKEALTALEQAVKNKIVRKGTLIYSSAFEAIKNPGMPVVCGKQTGSGRYAKSNSWKAQTSALLQRLGVTHSAFNIAQREGRWGDRITVTF